MPLASEAPICRNRSPAAIDDHARQRETESESGDYRRYLSFIHFHERKCILASQLTQSEPGGHWRLVTLLNNWSPTAIDNWHTLFRFNRSPAAVDDFQSWLHRNWFPGSTAQSHGSQWRAIFSYNLQFFPGWLVFPVSPIASLQEAPKCIIIHDVRRQFNKNTVGLSWTENYVYSLE